MGIVERKEREKEARRNMILDATEQVFQAKGIQQATMDDIAHQAELAKGTIYLYYRNKDELQLGVMLRAMDLMHESFHDAASSENLALKKFQAVGDAYWKFAHDEPFRFKMMCNADFPMRENISEEMILEVSEKSSWVWKLLVGIIDEAKREGTIKPEVESFSVAMLAWMNTMSVLRLYQKVQENMSKGTALIAKQSFNFCAMDFRKVYDLSIATLLSHAVTPEGAKYIPPVRFPSMEELGVNPGNALDDMNIAKHHIEPVVA
jgi:TetR/AcrR family transcriptional regulator